eukprot:XP_020406523.1 uncharacterized protein LOC109945124 [Zea mays]
MPQREKDLSSPTRVVGRRRIQHHRHEGPDVVQSSGLSVESSDEVSVEIRGEGVLRGFHRGDRRATEEALRGGHLGGQSGTQGTLSLQGEGGGALALPRGRHCGLDRSEGADERGVGGGEYEGRDGVASGWGSEGGKTRRGAAAQGQRGSDVEWPEAGDVGGPSMGELAADCSRGNGGGAWRGWWCPWRPAWPQWWRRCPRPSGRWRSRGVTVAVGLAAASERGRVWAAQHCCTICTDVGPETGSWRRGRAVGAGCGRRGGAGERRGGVPGGLAAAHGVSAVGSSGDGPWRRDWAARLRAAASRARRAGVARPLAGLQARAREETEGGEMAAAAWERHARTAGRLGREAGRLEPAAAGRDRRLWRRLETEKGKKP